MRVIELSTSDISGGAAIASYRLHTGLRQAGVDAQLVTSHKLTQDPTVYGHNPVTFKTKLTRHLDAFPKRFLHTPNTTLHSPAWISDGLFRKALTLSADLYQLHWVCGGLLTPPNLLELQAKPIVWTLHDMWAFCGAEHYTEDTRWRDGYTADNRPAGETGWDVNRWTWQRKQAAWSTLNNLTIISPSRWLGDLAKQSVLFKNKRVEVIPNGIDTNLYQPSDKPAARAALQLPQDKQLVLFGADYVKDERKGLTYLYAALEQLTDHPDIELVMFGHGQSADLPTSKFKTHFLGHLSSEAATAQAYAACDLFVLPSIMDNLPNSILEAMSCGTPCVAFDIGGLPDMINHERTGYLAKPKDSADLAHGITWCLNQIKLPNLSRDSRNAVIKNFTLSHQAERYLQLYQSLCAEFQA